VAQQRLAHGQPLVRQAGEEAVSRHFLFRGAQRPLEVGHDRPVIGVGSVELEQGELGIVGLRDFAVSKHLADLKDRAAAIGE
jgi:hypothetical protein